MRFAQLSDSGGSDMASVTDLGRTVFRAHALPVSFSPASHGSHRVRVTGRIGDPPAVRVAER